MTEGTHERAQRLIADGFIEGLTPDEQHWLSAHFAECDACARRSQSMRDAIVALRSTPVLADAALVSATRRSVRVYAERLRENESRSRLLVLSSVLVMVWSIVALPLLWAAFRWVGEWLSLTDFAWQLAFVVAWLLPGIVAGFALMMRRPHALLDRGAGE